MWFQKRLQQATASVAPHMLPGTPVQGGAGSLPLLLYAIAHKHSLTGLGMVRHRSCTSNLVGMVKQLDQEFYFYLGLRCSWRPDLDVILNACMCEINDVALVTQPSHTYT
jgi:hypothetical protein